MPQPADHTTEHTDAIEALGDAIRERLRRVCPNMSDEEFNGFLADIASMQARFAEIEARHMSSDTIDRSCEEQLDRQLPLGT